jgi:hypothetical protein
LEKGVEAGGESRENNDEEVRAERITLADASGQRKGGEVPQRASDKKNPVVVEGHNCPDKEWRDAIAAERCSKMGMADGVKGLGQSRKRI